MRGLLVMSVFLLVTACDSGDVPSPSERLAAGQAAGASDIDTSKVILRGDGFAAGAESFYFAAGKNEVETALKGVLGEPSGGQSIDECGAGPMQFTDYPSGLTVNFQDGSLVGWNWRLPQDGDEPALAEIELAGDVQLGTARGETESVSGFAMIAESTLGEEFSLGDRIGGFFDADEVSMLYAGTQCFFR